MKKSISVLLKGIMAAILCITVFGCPVYADENDADTTETIDENEVPLAASERPGSAAHQTYSANGLQVMMTAAGVISLSLMAYIIIKGEIREAGK